MTINIDENLLREAQKLSLLEPKEETVSLALKEFIQKRKQSEIIELFGTMDPDIEPYSKKFRYR